MGEEEHKLKQFHLIISGIVHKAFQEVNQKLDKRHAAYDISINVIKESIQTILTRQTIVETKVDTTSKVVLAIGAVLTLLNGIFTFMK